MVHFTLYHLIGSRFVVPSHIICDSRELQGHFKQVTCLFSFKNALSCEQSKYRIMCQIFLFGEGVVVWGTCLFLVRL